MTFALTLTFTGMFIVFIVLILLIAIFSVFGKVASAGNKKTQENHETVQEQAVIPVTEDGISQETVAVITAAIAALSDDGKSYRVKSIKRAQTGRPAWAAAGIADNTRPF